jgi:hypothetical protein
LFSLSSIHKSFGEQQAERMKDQTLREMLCVCVCVCYRVQNSAMVVTAAASVPVKVEVYARIGGGLYGGFSQVAWSIDKALGPLRSCLAGAGPAKLRIAHVA